jgi:hypothetical protein
MRGGVLYLWMGIPGNCVPDASEPVGAGSLQRFQHWLCSLAQIQVGVTDDGCRRSRGTIDTAGAGSGQPLGELHFANRPHLFWSVGAVHRSGLDKDGGLDVVAAVGIG